MFPSMLASRSSFVLHNAQLRGTLYCKSFASLALRQNQRELGIGLKQVHNADARSAEGQCPQNRVHSKIIKELGAQRQWCEAQAAFNSLAHKDTIIYNVMISAADACNRYAEGLELFAEMKRNSIAVTSVTYGAVFTLLGRMGNHQDARELWTEMKIKGIAATPPCLTGLLNSLASTGDVPAVEKHIEEVVAQGVQLNSHQWGCLLKACRESGNHAKALQVLQELQDHNVGITVVHCTLAVGACSKAARCERMDLAAVQDYIGKLENLMRVQNIRPDSYFLEEHVRALLGGVDLNDARKRNVATEPSHIDAALVVLQNAHESRIRITRLLMNVQEQLTAAANRRHANSAEVGPLPMGWHRTLDPTSGLHYYWNASDPNGTTTWERPS